MAVSKARKSRKDAETKSEIVNTHTEESSDGESNDSSDDESSQQESSSSSEEGCGGASAESEEETASAESANGEEEREDENHQIKQANATQAAMSSEVCTFDLRNLLAMSTHQVNSALLYQKQKDDPNDGNITVPSQKLSTNEDYLHEKAREGCTQLLSALWQLPSEKSDAGPLVTLPSHFETAIPRSLPPPPPKKETKWEKFAKERGIPTNKEKRSRKVWDETTGTWMYRHGYQKANNDVQQWPIMEVKGNEDPYADPWEKLRDAKRARVDKNTENRMRNKERQGLLPKGTATRVAKSREKSRTAGKAGGNVDRDGVLPSGVPVDLENRKASHKNKKSIQRGKESTHLALLATQRSTASLGKFDKMREGEPERKKALAGLKKRKFESTTDKKVLSTEADRGMKLLKTVMNGGGTAREKAKRSGSLAKGETAYDYEFDDGLGPGDFKKKKGRAGAGKMKKMTRKRVK